MKLSIPTALAAALALTFSTTSCDVDQTQAGELPDVDIEGGQLPKYDVDAPDVDIGTKEVEVTVPDIDIEPADDDDLEDYPQDGQ
jgi:hypothetical protein